MTSHWLCSSSHPVSCSSLTPRARVSPGPSYPPHSQTSDRFLAHRRLQEILAQKNDLPGEYRTSKKNLWFPRLIFVINFFLQCTSMTFVSSKLILYFYKFGSMWTLVQLWSKLLCISKCVESKLMKMLTIPFQMGQKIKARSSRSYYVYQGWKWNPVLTASIFLFQGFGNRSVAKGNCQGSF